MNQENLNALIEMNNKLGSDLPAVQEAKVLSPVKEVENSLTDFLIQRLNKLTEDSDFERKIKDNILQRLPEASFEELTELLHNVSSDNTLSTTSVMELFKLNDNDKNITDALKEDNISNAATELYNSTDDKNVLQALTYLGQIMEQMSTPVSE